MDEVFGPDNYLNEVIWKRQSAHSDTKQGSQHYGRLHDVIFLYKKGDDYTWNQQYQPYDPAYVATFFKNVDENGRQFQYGDLTGPGGPAKGNPVYEFLGVTRAWRYSKQKMQKLYDEGRIEFRPGGKVPRLKRYLDESPGVPAQDIWSDITYGSLINFGVENLGYPTQKPELLLERIIKTSSNEGALVLDCFCGSGTTAAVAEKLNRRWIACDLGRFAIHTTRKRLLQIPGVKPFVVQNLGKYERQLWQTGEFAAASDQDPSLALRAGKVADMQRAYVEFILQLYGASPLHGYTWLHGTKGGRPVHVGSVEAPVSAGDVSRIAAEFKKAMGSGKDAPTSNGVDVLGWDFAFEVNEVARQQAEAANLRLNFKRIPRDVMDKRAVAQGDIHFFELAALGVDAKARGRAVTLALADFVIPPDDVPEDVRAAVKHWSQWIDYWAVDWDNKGDAFHNEWQTFRTRKEGKLALTASHTYAEPGEYRVVVKVIDILGNDTTKTVKVKVK